MLLTTSEGLRNGLRTRSAHPNLYQKVDKKQSSMATVSYCCIIGIRFLSVRLKADARGSPSGGLAVGGLQVHLHPAGRTPFRWRPGSRLQIKSNRHYHLPLKVAPWREVRWPVGGGDYLYFCAIRCAATLRKTTDRLQHCCSNPDIFVQTSIMNPSTS